ncbi:MAG: nuclear transport factor 2 family protein [Polyangiaceae bacterium]|nr:nuclear transport factor 2 family protein [Polyangiaceae bacterium]
MTPIPDERPRRASAPDAGAGAPGASDPRLRPLVTRFLDAWSAQDVERVLDCYTDDVRYRDPNTRGFVEGRAALRRYLTKLFSAWQMTWHERELFALREADGVAFLWRATFRRPGGAVVVEADGMDLALLEGERLARNEVYFDRAVLAPFLGAPG